MNDEILGLDKRRAALAFSLHALGVLVYRFFTFWLPILPALALFPTVGSLNRELGRVPKESAA